MYVRIRKDGKTYVRKSKKKIKYLIAIALVALGILLVSARPVRSDDETPPSPNPSVVLQLPIIPDKPTPQKQREIKRTETAAQVATIARANGYSEGEVEALLQLLNRESGLRTTAQNPTSSAYGIFQFLDSTWQGTGVAKTSDLEGQMEAGLIYIERRYGDAITANEFQLREGYY